VVEVSGLRREFARPCESDDAAADLAEGDALRRTDADPIEPHVIAGSFRLQAGHVMQQIRSWPIEKAEVDGAVHRCP
jgi:hypothetical protein